MIRRALFRFALLGFVFLAASCAGHTQTSGGGVSELVLDLRARVAAVGASGGSLQSAAFRTEKSLAPGLRVQFYGTRSFGAFGVQQAFIEKEWGGNAGRAQAGMVRLPFGIYEPREVYATGLINYPLARNDYGSHSVDWGVPGISWTGGPPNLQIEAAAFGGKGTGVWSDQGRIHGAAVRAQTYAGDAIFGLSRWDGTLQDDDTAASSPNRPVHMTGLDLRYTKTRLLVRGEYLFGTLAGDRMAGWYLDAYYRLPQHEHWSLVGRVEALKPGSGDATGRQVTLGVRDVVARDWTLAVNWRQNNGLPYGSDWTPSASKSGDIYLQAYHRVAW